MMDLTPLAQSALVYSVLAVAILATLLTSFAQLRELPKAWESGPNPALVRRGFLAASVGMGSIGGTVLAIEIGGPGAIGWMWVASLLGMGAIYAEVLLSTKARRKVGGKPRAATVHVLADALGGSTGQIAALIFAMLFMVFAIAAGALLQTNQGSVLLEPLGGDRMLITAFLVVAAAIALLVPKLRTFIVALGPVAVALYVLALLLIIVRAPGDVGSIFASFLSGMGGVGPEQMAGGAAGATFLMALQAGFLRATLATEAGIGSAGFTPQADTVRDPSRAAAAAMLAPLVSGIVVPTLTAIAVLGSTPWIGQRVDEPGERMIVEGRAASEVELAELAGVFAEGDLDRLTTYDRKRLEALWAPLERPQSRGTAASLQAGQTVVLPTDAVAPEGATDDSQGLLVNYVYPMIMRANPRGMKLALGDGENAIILARSGETETISEIVYRAEEPERAPYAAYDLRVPVDNEIIGPDDGPQFVRLSPKDKGTNLSRLKKIRDGPYVVFGDYQFEARVVEMFSKRWGPHHALIEVEDSEGLPRPIKLRTAVTGGGFRGPYFDTGEPRAPLAMVAREGFDAPVGARLRLEYRAPERGLAIGKLLTNGELVTPPWTFLAETKFVKIRHKTDPAKDMYYPVNVELIDGALHFTSARRNMIDFAKADRWRDYTGPYLMPPAYEFEVEVHDGARFPASNAYLERLGQERQSLTGPLAERRTLVAVHPEPEPTGSHGELYDPHPAEVAPFMDGPWVVGAGVDRLGHAALLGVKPGVSALLGVAILALALTTMIAWAGYGARAADFVLGRGSGIGFMIVFLLAALGGASVELLPILRVVDYSMIGLVVLNGLGLVLGLWKARAER